MTEKNKKIAIVPALLLLVSAAALYLTHRSIPFMMDDLWYSTLLYEETPIASLGDILKSQIWHYQNWGGRSITHSILQLTLLLGERAADILNVAVTFLLAAMIAALSAKNAGGRRHPWLYLIFAALGMVLGLNADWKMSMFWQSGAANYLYITVLLLGFLYCYLREVPEKEQEEKQPKRLWGITFWIVPLGLFAGWSNENMGPAVWIVSLLVLLLLKREHKKIRPWMLLGSAACLLGSAAMIAAPGNFVRSSQVPEKEYGFLWQCFLRGYSQSRGVLEYLFPVLLVLAGAALLGKCVLSSPSGRFFPGRRNLLLLLCALLSWGAMLLSPHYPARAAFGTTVLFICAALSIAYAVFQKRRDTGRLLLFAVCLIWLRGMYFMGEYLAVSWGWIK